MHALRMRDCYKATRYNIVVALLSDIDRAVAANLISNAQYPADIGFFDLCAYLIEAYVMRVL